jgi:hypothetical protein
VTNASLVLSFVTNPFVLLKYGPIPVLHSTLNTANVIFTQVCSCKIQICLHLFGLEVRNVASENRRGHEALVGYHVSWIKDKSPYNARRNVSATSLDGALGRGVASWCLGLVSKGRLAFLAT